MGSEAVYTRLCECIRAVVHWSSHSVFSTANRNWAREPGPTTLLTTYCVVYFPRSRLGESSLKTTTESAEKISSHGERNYLEQREQRYRARRSLSFFSGHSRRCREDIQWRSKKLLRVTFPGDWTTACPLQCRNRRRHNLKYSFEIFHGQFPL